VWVAIPLLALFAVIFFAINARERHADEPSALRLALFGGAAYDMSLWATVAQNANNAPAEIALREAALREDPDNRPLQAELLAALLRHGKCDSTMPWTEGKSTSALLAACGGQKANPTPAVR
jgi:hypothetical protein